MYGIFTNIYHENQPNVGKYTSPMDATGYSHKCASAIPQQRRFYVKPLELGRRAVKLDEGQGPELDSTSWGWNKKGSENQVCKAI